MENPWPAFKAINHVEMDASNFQWIYNMEKYKTVYNNNYILMGYMSDKWFYTGIGPLKAKCELLSDRAL